MTSIRYWIRDAPITRLKVGVQNNWPDRNGVIGLIHGSYRPVLVPKNKEPVNMVLCSITELELDRMDLYFLFM